MQSWIIPAHYFAFINELFNFALRKDSVTDVEARVFPDIGLVNVKVLKELVVGLAADLELESTERMGDILERVDEAMSVIICWVDAPLIARVWMGCIANAIGSEVSHAWIIVLHVHFHTESALTFSKPALSHLVEVAKIVFD